MQCAFLPSRKCLCFLGGGLLKKKSIFFYSAVILQSTECYISSKWHRTVVVCCNPRPLLSVFLMWCRNVSCINVVDIPFIQYSEGFFILFWYLGLTCPHYNDVYTRLIIVYYIIGISGVISQKCGVIGHKGFLKAVGLWFIAQLAYTLKIKLRINTNTNPFCRAFFYSPSKIKITNSYGCELVGWLYNF